MSSSSKLEKIGELEFRWGRRKGAAKDKDIFFYDSFSYDGVEYRLHDSVYMYNGRDKEPFVGKIIKAWENLNKIKLVKIHWYFRPSEIAYYLKDEDVLENELFFASGEGRGLANINPLEAIAGKCNVVCISKDDRNPQPTTEEIQMADYVFYRVFDVQKLTVSDRIKDTVGGIEVKFVFNDEALLNRLRRSDTPQHANIVLGRKDMDAKQVKRKYENLLGQSSQQVGGPGKILDTKSHTGLGDKNSEREINELNRFKHFKSSHSQVEGEHRVESAGKDDSREGAQPKRAKHESKLAPKEMEGQGMVNIEVNKVHSCSNTDDHIELGKNKVVEDISKETPLLRQASDSIEVGNYENNTIKKYGMLEGEPPDATSSLVGQQLKINEQGNVGNVKRKKLNVEEGGCAVSQENVLQLRERTKALKTSFSGRTTSSSNEDVQEHDSMSIGKSSKFSNGRPMKANAEFLNVKSNDAPNISQKTMKLGDSRLIEGTQGKEEKLGGHGDLFEDNEKSIPKKIEKGNFSIEKSYKLKAPQKRVDDEKLVSAPNQSGKEKAFGEIFEVTKKDTIVTKITWIKLPWEQRLQRAQVEGTLVLLQNLDPEYTSSEVEDIIWHAFDEDCKAKVVHYIARSNPCYGQAFAIFKTRETADRILKKLDEGCLMLPNQRPLVARLGDISVYLDDRITFFGHLAIDKARRQILRGTREAVSTSHCAQSNTIEYEMAMSWCLLQSKYDKCLEELWKQQRSELEKLTIKVK